MAKTQQKQETPPPTVLTITLPAEDGQENTGTVLVDHGDQAQLCQFTYTELFDVMSAMYDASAKLADLQGESNAVLALFSESVQKETSCE